MKNAWFIFVITVTALVICPLRASGQVFFMENPSVGKEAEDFTLEVLDGGEVSLSEFREGQKAIIFFWATWCPHCRDALEVLKERNQEIEDREIKLVLVDVGESREVVQQYFNKNDIYFNVFLDVETQVAERYGVIGIPTFYYIGEDGIVRKVQNNLPQDLEMVFYGV